MTTLFPRTSFIGFDQILSDIERIAASAKDTYPPHNILKTSDTAYAVEVAVAGFSINDLAITLKDHMLYITGEQKESSKEYVHKGISTKRFSKGFRLNEHLEVAGASLKDGILTITLELKLPTNLETKTIQITTL